ncbi:hypothetical protein RHSP_36194 [Rhizobium freirei PRF 81]|uniref:PAS domain-containing protein n=1 Tax=Rhizobium freirei PRF 81 TaxID=363754 RepID=N6UVM7_9HYPH|nr:hypothetical protein RHSP_36194 [Rhizobium freirei PRF 81]
MENTADNNPRFRLAGTTICNLMGREIRGEDFAVLWAGSQREDPVHIAAGVMRHVVPAVIRATGYCISGRSVAFEMMLMPLRSSSDICDRLLGCLTPAAPAPWLGNECLEFLALDRSRLLYDRPVRVPEPSPQLDMTDLLAPRENTRLGEWMRRKLNLAILGQDAGESEPPRDKIGLRPQVTP